MSSLEPSLPMLLLKSIDFLQITLLGGKDDRGTRKSKSFSVGRNSRMIPSVGPKTRQQPKDWTGFSLTTLSRKKRKIANPNALLIGDGGSQIQFACTDWNVIVFSS